MNLRMSRNTGARRVSRFCIACSLLAFSAALSHRGVRAGDRWSILEDGTGIVWPVAQDGRCPHSDFVEMSGLRVSTIYTYSVDSNKVLSVGRRLFWPGFRRQPNNTHGHLTAEFAAKRTPALSVGGVRVTEKAESVRFDGVLETISRIGDGLTLDRKMFPSVDAPVVYELATVRNAGSAPVVVSAGADVVSYAMGCDGRYEISARLRPQGAVTVAPGASAEWSLSFSAHRIDVPVAVNPAGTELVRRKDRVKEITDACVLVTGNKVIDTMFRLAKIHAAENVFSTRGGLMHSPGGGTYLAATWCNDQVEYAGPWFAFTGDKTALEASMTAYSHYMPFMAPDYAPIPCSVIAEGFDYWNGAGDRGDAAMWAYGASRFVLTSGRKDWAKKLLPGIRWTLEYCRRKLTPEGVVASRRDELEGRLPSGKANLCTSTLYCDALRHAAILVGELGFPDEAKEYAARERAMRDAIERYFGATIHGFKTYRYYEGCGVLRSWIGIPLAMGIFDRTDGTCDALFSKYLWTGAGMLSAEGDRHGTTWDRSLLYAFRGLLAAGKTDSVIPKLEDYSRSRLLGEHVPYAIEAWPEGGRRHLSAESALYCRIIVEGLFGISPAGFAKYDVKPHLPKGWKKMELRNIRAFGNTFSVTVTEDGTTVDL